MNKENFRDTIMLIGRFLIAFIFITAGYSKIGGYDGTLAYMTNIGVPSFFLPLVILLELGGGIAIVLGFLTRFTSLFMVLFCVLTAFMFHGEPADATMFNKNIALAGGFMFLLAQGAGRFSIDQLIKNFLKNK